MITIEQLKAYAQKAEEELGEVAHKFVAFVERELGLAPTSDTGASADAAIDPATGASADGPQTDAATIATEPAPAAADGASAGAAPAAEADPAQSAPAA